MSLNILLSGSESALLPPYSSCPIRFAFHPTGQLRLRSTPPRVLRKHILPRSTSRRELGTSTGIILNMQRFIRSFAQAPIESGMDLSLRVF
eukprot:6198048-Pyramimonas_sp.AAC.1